MGYDLTQLLQAVDIAPSYLPDAVTRAPRLNAAILVLMVPTVQALHNVQEAFSHKALMHWTHGTKGVGRHSHASGGTDPLKNFNPREPWRHLLKRTEKEEIAFGRSVLHAEKDTHPIGLRTFLDLMPDSHCLVIRDTDTIQTPDGGMAQNLPQGELTAG